MVAETDAVAAMVAETDAVAAVTDLDISFKA
jgi:hypothetical protein